MGACHPCHVDVAIPTYHAHSWLCSDTSTQNQSWAALPTSETWERVHDWCPVMQANQEGRGEGMGIAPRSPEGITITIRY